MDEYQIDKEKKMPGSIGERLAKLIQHYHLNMNSLSMRLQLKSNSVITRVVKDPNRAIGLELIQKILFEFPEINADWFVTGRGEMLITKREIRPEVKNDLLFVIEQKDETIANLKEIIRSKNETIRSKDALIANLEGRSAPGKEVAST